MKIAIEIDDNNIIADVLDAMVLSHLKTCKQNIIEWQSPDTLEWQARNKEDIKYDKKLIKALNVLIEYYGGYNAVQ
jgi:hypothetical protein